MSLTPHQRECLIVGAAVLSGRWRPYCQSIPAMTWDNSPEDLTPLPAGGISNYTIPRTGMRHATNAGIIAAMLADLREHGGLPGGWDAADKKIKEEEMDDEAT